jgi:hypothetical protein
MLDFIRSHFQVFVLNISQHSGGEIIAKLTAVGTTCVDTPRPSQGWTSSAPTKITSGPTQNLDWKVMMVGSYTSF